MFRYVAWMSTVAFSEQIDILTYSMGGRCCLQHGRYLWHTIHICFASLWYTALVFTAAHSICGQSGLPYEGTLWLVPWLTNATFVPSNGSCHVQGGYLLWHAPVHLLWMLVVATVHSCSMALQTILFMDADACIIQNIFCDFPDSFVFMVYIFLFMLQKNFENSFWEWLCVCVLLIQVAIL